MIRSIFIGWASCCLCAGPSPCRADDAIATVAISAGKLDQRRNDTAAMIVIGHDELMQHGDTTLADVLQRLPGISIAGAPGQGGEIRMHGLGNGYTQIMLDGVPAPAGFALDSLAPDLIERIEIMRVASAQLSNQAIAGAINIVLKKKVLAAQREFSAGLAQGGQGGRSRSPSASAQLSDRAAAWSWTLAATLAQQRTPAASLEREVAADAQGQPSLLRLTPQRDDSRNDTVSVAPRLSWSPGGGDTVVSQNYASASRIDKSHSASETDVLGAPGDYPDSASRYGATVRVLRSDLDWTHALDGGASLELKLGGNDSRRRAGFRFTGADGDTFLGEHQVASGSTDTMLQFTGAWRQPLGEQHVLALGWDASDKRRDELRIEHDFSATGALSAATDDSYTATIASLALYAQEEWTISPRWSLYLGLRRESVLTRSATAAPAEAPAAVNRASVWSPLLQLLFKFAGKDQLRRALSHTYKTPAIGQLIPRRYVIDNNNSATNPDTQGNPHLRPELAWGLDAALEHYAGAGLFSASVYLRRLRDVTIDSLSQSNGVWLSMPVNGGGATMRGIELEAKLPLQSLDPRAPPLELHANLTRNWSAIAAIPGPDNRIDGQTALSANAGLDYRPADARLSAGANLGVVQAGPVRLSPLLSSDASPKRQLDLYALWKIDGHSRLRLPALNLLRQDYVTGQRYADAAGAESRTLVTPGLPTLRLVWEQAF